MNNTELFKLMVQNQNEWRKQYYQNQKTKQVIRVICNRRYKSKSHHTLEQIQKELKQLGLLDEVTVIEEETGEQYYSLN